VIFICMPAQNLIFPSSAIATAPWGDDGTATRTNNYGQVAAPDGTFTATRIQWIAGGAPGSHYVYPGTTTLPSGIKHTVSAWMRATSNTAIVRLRLADAVGISNTHSSDFVLDTVWRRYSLTVFLTNGGTTNMSEFESDTGSNAADFLVWGYQHEQANAPGDYVKTTTAAIDFGAPANKRLPQNLITYSQNFTTGPWTPTGAGGTNPVVTITTDTLAPDGTQTASKLAENGADPGGNFAKLLLNLYSGGIQVGRTVTISIWARPGTLNYLWLSPDDASTLVSFDLTTGIVGTTAGTILAAGSKAFPNGWRRCYVTAAMTSSVQRARVYMAPNNTLTNWHGDGTGTQYYWGIQVDLSDAPGDYVATTTQAIT
jgi:hypothetical protein